MNKKFLRIENISLFRNEIYGIAILWVVLFHGKIMNNVHLEDSMPILNKILGFGNVGVDIFLFLSGISCVLSYQKNPNCDHFYSKRLWRLLPFYLCFSYAVISFYQWPCMPTHS